MKTSSHLLHQFRLFQGMLIVSLLLFTSFQDLKSFSLSLGIFPGPALPASLLRGRSQHIEGWCFMLKQTGLWSPSLPSAA